MNCLEYMGAATLFEKAWDVIRSTPQPLPQFRKTRPFSRAPEHWKMSYTQAERVEDTVRRYRAIRRVDLQDRLYSHVVTCGGVISLGMLMEDPELHWALAELDLHAKTPPAVRISLQGADGFQAEVLWERSDGLPAGHPAAAG